MFRGSDGVDRYVKFYADSTQSYCEAIANRIYNRLGLGAGESALTVRGEKLAIATKMIPKKGTFGELGLTQARAEKALEGFVADVWRANWGAAGTGLDNLIEALDGRVVRIDNGGSLLFRAQAGRKPEHLLHELTEWEGLVDKSPYYKKLFIEAGLKDADALGARAINQIDAILKLGAETREFEDFVPVLPGVNPTDRAQILALLRVRAQKLAEVRNRLAEAHEAKAKKVAPAKAPAVLERGVTEAEAKAIAESRLNGYSP